MHPISLTAFYTCGIRADDALSARPIVGDAFAVRCMTPEGQGLVDSLRDLRNPWRSVLARHRRIDERVRSALDADPDLLVVLLGAGFDSRAWRLGAGRWLEIDEHALIDFKETRMPQAQCPRPLTRIAVDFAHDRLIDVLAPWRTEGRCLVILEGVLLYLDQTQVTQTAQALRILSPRLTVLFDRMTPTFVRRAGMAVHRRLQARGAPFRMQHVDIPGIWHACGYRTVGHISIPTAMAELGIAPMPRWMLATSLFRWLREGYEIVEVELPRT